MMKILFLGDIVGSPGRSAVIDNLAGIKKEYEIDFMIVNGENSAGGRGITPVSYTHLTLPTNREV